MVSEWCVPGVFSSSFCLWLTSFGRGSRGLGVLTFSLAEKFFTTPNLALGGVRSRIALTLKSSNTQTTRYQADQREKNYLIIKNKNFRKSREKNPLEGARDWKIFTGKPEVLNDRSEGRGAIKARKWQYL